MDTLLVTAAEMRAIEAAAAEHGDTSEVLMDRAGARIAEHMLGSMPDPAGERVLVLAGPGNNGGDALVVAALLHKAGCDVQSLTWARSPEKDKRLQNPLTALKIPIQQLDNRPTETLRDALAWCTLVLDGLLGTGIKRDVEGPLADIVIAVAASHLPVVAVDIPTGVDSDTGAVRGVALPAATTIALGLIKYGHVLYPGAGLCGELFLGEIGLSEQTSQKAAPGRQLDEAYVRKLLPERPNDSNKGTFGKAMVVAGSINYLGAPVLATQGAMRSGAGLVTLACAGDLVSLVAPKLTECTFLLLPSDMGSIAVRATDKLKENLEGYDALLIGCGLGKERETGSFLKALLSEEEAVSERRIGFASRAEHSDHAAAPKAALPPLVLDGDALNLLAEIGGEWFKQLPEGTVLTPHPGEMARLLGSTVEEVQSDRVGIAKKAAADWNAVVVLKGAATVIAEPGGKVFVSPFANPALATAGTGDVLAGTIVGLRAQGLSPVDAACAGVYLHGMAGELLGDEYGVAGGLAGDLPVLLARAQRQLRAGK